MCKLYFDFQALNLPAEISPVSSRLNYASLCFTLVNKMPVLIWADNKTFNDGGTYTEPDIDGLDTMIFYHGSKIFQYNQSLTD